jgi:hypothetical protein
LSICKTYWYHEVDSNHIVGSRIHRLSHINRLRPVNLINRLRPVNSINRLRPVNLGTIGAVRLLSSVIDLSQGVTTFNDDIESTAAAVVAAVMGAVRLDGVPPLSDQHFVFVGAGQAVIGSARLLSTALQEEGTYLSSQCLIMGRWLSALISTLKHFTTHNHQQSRAYNTEESWISMWATWATQTPFIALFQSVAFADIQCDCCQRVSSTAKRSSL